jgi:2-dehydro-3-deoxyphosphogluconate aldolase/(4S)-4-hydroxy-2-oxoglutarate aldolase
MDVIIESLGKIGIVPVIKIDNAVDAVPLARAIEAGGIACAEITFRTDAAEDAIRRIAGELPGALVGAGTVLTIEQLDKALGAGAQFIVTPGFNPRIVAHALDRGAPIIPGCSTPTDIEQALEFGLEVVKFFPAEQSGGLDYLKAVAAPYSQVRFVPTGGIGAANLAKYLGFGPVLACGGSWMAKEDLVKAGNFAGVTALCAEALRIAAEARNKGGR